MGEYKGNLMVPGVVDWPLSVVIELDAESITIGAAGFTIGRWSLDDVEIVGRDQGFELQVDGEHLFVSTTDDGEFARAVGVPWLQRTDGPMNPGRMGQSSHRAQRAVPDASVRTSDLRASFIAAEAPKAPLKMSGLGRGRHERRGRGRHRR